MSASLNMRQLTRSARIVLQFGSRPAFDQGPLGLSQVSGLLWSFPLSHLLEPLSRADMTATMRLRRLERIV
jgi:hypothetical protein